MFNVAKEMSKDKSGTNNVADGNKKMKQKTKW